MSGYIANVEVALILFPLLAALLAAPYAVYQYRRYGSIPWWKTFLVATFIFYLMCAYFMVILPLPADRDVYIAAVQTPQLTPFKFVGEIARHTTLDPASPSSWIAWLKSGYVYTVLFNFLLTMPFGAYLGYLFDRRWWQVLLLGFGLALFFELSQWTGLLGLYAHPYRLFDVDDLITNTTGAMLGFWASIPLLRFVPDLDDMNERSRLRASMRTSFSRRLLAFAVDMLVLGVVSGFLGGVFRGAFDGAYGYLANQVLSSGVVFGLVPVLTRGQTLGHKLLKLRVARPDGTPANRVSIAARYLLLFWCFLLAPQWVAALFPLDAATGAVTGAAVDEAFAVGAATVRGVTVLVQAFWLLSVAVRAVRSALGHPFVMVNGLMTNTRVYSTEQIARMAGETATEEELAGK